MKRKPAWRKLPERNAQLKTQQQGSVKPGWAHAPVCEPRQPGKLIAVVGAIVVAVLLLFLLLWWLLSFWFLYPSGSVVVLVVPLVLVPLVVLGFIVLVLRIFSSCRAYCFCSVSSFCSCLFETNTSCNQHGPKLLINGAF